ncbi:ester cyclase [Nocardia sp. NPDC003963]
MHRAVKSASAIMDSLAEPSRTVADLHHDIRTSVAEGDYVATFVFVAGRDLGDWHGLSATGKEFCTPEMHLFRINDGPLIEMWSLAR